MKAIIINILILMRILTHHGDFLDQRRMPPKRQAPEVRAAILRTWKKGGKKLFYFNKFMI